MTEQDEKLLLAIKEAINNFNEALKDADDAGIMVFCKFRPDRTIAPGYGGPPYMHFNYAYRPEWTASSSLTLL